MRQTRSTRRRFVLLASSTAFTGVAGCARSATSNDPGGSPTQTDATQPTDTPATDSPTKPDATGGAAVVEMLTDNQGTYFDPKGRLVEPGTTVRFINESGSHGATAYHPDNDDQPQRIPTAAEPWDSPIFTEPNQHFEVQLEVEGVYDYYCPPHESMGMVGRIIVGEPHDGPGTEPSDDLPPGAQEAFPPIEEVLANDTVAGP